MFNRFNFNVEQDDQRRTIVAEECRFCIDRKEPYGVLLTVVAYRTLTRCGQDPDLEAVAAAVTAEIGTL